MLRYRRFFRHQDRPKRPTSYIDVICVIWCHMHHLMSYAHMTSIYDISRFGRSWCLNDRLDVSNHTLWMVFGLLFFKIGKKQKACRKKFPFISFLDPLYFLTKQEVKFAMTSETARNLILFANPNRIKMWTRLGG